MFATVTDVVKNFACGGLFSFLHLNFVHDSIYYLCANCDKCCKEKFSCGGLSVFIPIFQFRQFLAPSKIYSYLRHCSRLHCMHTLIPRGCQNVLTPLGGPKKFRAPREFVFATP